MNASTRDALWLHLLFLALAVPLLLMAEGASHGQRLLWLLIGYHVAVPLLGLVRGHSDWLFLWLFLLPLCLGQALPEWALVRVAGVLSFPDHGLPQLGGDLPLSVFGLWLPLLFPLTLLGLGSRHPLLSLAPLALLLFAAAEWAATPLGLWQHRGVLTLQGIALYPLLPQMLLTLAALWSYRSFGRGPIVSRLGIALGLNVFYTGACFLSLLATEYIFRSALLAIL